MKQSYVLTERPVGETAGDTFRLAYGTAVLLALREAGVIDARQQDICGEALRGRYGGRAEGA